MLIGAMSAVSPRFQQPGTRSLTPLGWRVTGMATTAGFGFYFWFKGKLAELGYQF